MRTFRCIYVNYFNRLRFLAEVGTKIFCFFGQYTDHNSGRKHGNQTNDPIFSSTFSTLTVCNIHFCIHELTGSYMKATLAFNGLKELQNCILCIVRMWALFCSVQVCIFYHSRYVSSLYVLSIKATFLSSFYAILPLLNLFLFLSTFSVFFSDYSVR